MPFANVSTLRPDAKGRITLGAWVKGVSSLRVTRDKHHRIILEPFTEIPAREKWLWDNDPAMAKVRLGLRQSATGKTHDLGSFAKHKDTDIE